MGNTYAKDETGIWQPTLDWAKTSSGWARVKQAYRKTGTTAWTLFQTFDLTPPAAPLITSIVIEGRLLKITVTAPVTADVRMVRVKVNKGAAAGNNSVDSAYVSTPDGADVHWSDWAMSPGQTRTKYYPTPDGGALTNGATYFVTAWAQDTGRNFSSPVTQSQKFTTTAVGALPSARTVYVTTTDSRTYYQSNRTWSADKNCRVGDITERQGFFFYGNKLQTTLAKSIELSRLTLQVQRINHVDYSGAARFKIFAHAKTSYNVATTVGSGGVGIIDIDQTWRTLNQGATGNYVLPGSWYDRIRSGVIRGFGLLSQRSSGGDLTDPNSGSYYGYPTNSGRLFAEWVQ